jgi:hypothetical protein
VILWAVRWSLQFPLSYRDLERLLADRGVAVDHTTMDRWVQRFAPELEIPAAKLVVFDTGGHLFVGRQDEVNAAVAEFLAGVARLQIGRIEGQEQVGA